MIGLHRILDVKQVTKDLLSSDICKLLHIKQKDDTNIDSDHHVDQMKMRIRDIKHNYCGKLN